MFKVKICGVTQREDAEIIQAAGADAIGFIFCPSSRQVMVETVKAITSSLKKSGIYVGVFKDQEPDWINSTVRQCHLDVVQLHGDETPEFIEHIHVPCIKVLPIHGKISFEHLGWAHSKAAALLLDSGAGGTGKTFDWSVFHSYRILGKPLLLAGGLNPENVESAIIKLHPMGVDASSGVEKSPGIKEPQKVEAFVKAAVRGFQWFEQRGGDERVSG